METNLVKKHLFALFLQDEDEIKNRKWTRIKKAVELTRNMNPTTEDYDYIADEHPTTEVTGYKPNEDVTVKTLKEEADYELFYRLYKERAIGNLAHREILSVSLFDKKTVNGEPIYYAELEDGTVVINSYNFSSSEITAGINHNGTPKKGYVKIVDGEPIFTEADWDAIEEDEETSNTSNENGGQSNSNSQNATKEYFSSVAEFIESATKVSENVSYEDSEETSHDDGVTYSYNNVTYLYDGTALYTGTVESDVWTSLVSVDVTTIEKIA